MKPRARVYDPFSTTAWTPRPAKSEPAFAQTAANSAFAPTVQQPTTQFGLGEAGKAIATAARERTMLENDYPQIAQAITLLWGYPEMNQYFDKLWLADGTSEPIHPEVMADLMLLARIHQHLAPARKAAGMTSIYGTAYEKFFKQPDPWKGDYNRRR